MYNIVSLHQADPFGNMDPFGGGFSSPAKKGTDSFDPFGSSNSSSSSKSKGVCYYNYFLLKYIYRSPQFQV